MLVPNDMEGKVIGVLGLGTSGRAAVDVLNAAGAEVFSFDDMTDPHQNLFSGHFE